MAHFYGARPYCGCWYPVMIVGQYYPVKKYLPQVDLSSHTTILATTSRTTLTQRFVNTSKDSLEEVQYTFPLYDGVSVVGFKCTVASRTIVGVVKEKQQARSDYKKAVERGETAGLLEQMPEAADVFTTRIGNIPPKESVIVEIVYLGELKHDAETDGSRFTIPTVIAPRYGSVSNDTANLPQDSTMASDSGGIRILVDVAVEEGSIIRGLQSPSHPIAITLGRTSTMSEETFANHFASATLTLGSSELEQDFVIVVQAKGQEVPRALLEQHPSIKGQRALMATLVPKFNLPPILPEIVFVVDRSGSMDGSIPTLVKALKIFLKSLPIGVKFNICSFGSSHKFLWGKSKSYDESTLQKALGHLESFSANFGGTEMLEPVKATVKNRYKDMPLEVMIITDGQIWNQEDLFKFINQSATESVRFFSLGIGSGASSSLVEGIARAGDGFAQFVAENEKMDKRVVRMLKGALTPHIKNYSLEVKYEKDEDEFEIVESVAESLKGLTTSDNRPSVQPATKKLISLFDPSAKEVDIKSSGEKYDHLPKIAIPKLLQAPHKIPSLYAFNRTTVYLFMSPESCQRTPKAVVLKATCEHGPLELEIPVQDVGFGESVHQLAAKKAIHELEDGRGWITEARNDKGNLIKTKYEGRWEEMVEREAVRLGVQFQVGGKWCSFVAVEANSKTEEESEVRVGTQEESEARMGRGSPNVVNFNGNSPMKMKRTAHSIRSAGLHSASPVGVYPMSNLGALGAGGAPGAPQAPPPPYLSAAQPPMQAANAMVRMESSFAPQQPSQPVMYQQQMQQAQQTQQTQTYGAVTHAHKSRKKSGGLFGSFNPYPSFGGSSQTATRGRGGSAFGFGASNVAACAALAVDADHTDEEADKDEDEAMDGGDSYEKMKESTPKRPAKDKKAKAVAVEKREAVMDENRLDTLIALQAFDGSWSWHRDLFSAIGWDEKTVDGLFTANKNIGSNNNKNNNAVKATIAAIAFLQAKMAADEDVWEMVVDKAVAWLQAHAGSDCADVVASVKRAMASL